MSQNNELLIKNISEKIASLRPDAKILFSSVEDRRKGQFIIEYFPWPIGVEVRRLISGDRTIQDQNRLEQLIKTGERSIQFLAFCLISDVWSNIQKEEVEITQDLKYHVQEIDRPSLGTWAGMVRACSTLAKINQQSFFLNADVNWKKLNELAIRFVELRNTKVHHGGSINFNEIETTLCELLCEMCFLTKFQLVTVRDIQVRKTRLKPAKFEHNLALLNSTHKDFTVEKFDASIFAESQAVLLLSQPDISGNYLNLFPLVIDTTPFLKTDGQLNGINGIFLYHHRKNDKVIYVGTEPTVNAELNGWSIQEDIMAQLDDLKKCFSHE